VRRMSGTGPAARRRIARIRWKVSGWVVPIRFPAGGGPGV
jgi:hypothetical protein